LSDAQVDMDDDQKGRWIKSHRQEYEAKSPDELIDIVHSCSSPSEPAHILAQQVIHSHQADAVAKIDGRLAVVEAAAKKSEFRRWSFWLSVGALIVSGLAVIRAYEGWSAQPRPAEPSLRSNGTPPLSGLPHTTPQAFGLPSTASIPLSGIRTQEPTYTPQPTFPPSTNQSRP
jgi:hypothetical protein